MRLVSGAAAIEREHDALRGHCGRPRGRAVVVVTGGRAAPAESHAISQTCSATDRQFIDLAQVNTASVGLFGDSYLRGDAKPAEVISAARDADLALAQTAPRDGSLSTRDG